MSSSLAYALDIFPESRLSLLRYRGTLSLDDFHASAGALWADLRYDRTYAGLADLREATFRFRRDELAAFASALEQDPRHSAGRWAVLVAEPMETALILMLTRLMQDAAPQIAVFSTLEAASAWLNVHIDQARLPSISEIEKRNSETGGGSTTH